MRIQISSSRHNEQLIKGASMLFEDKASSMNSYEVYEVCGNSSCLMFY